MVGLYMTALLFIAVEMRISEYDIAMTKLFMRIDGGKIFYG